MSIDITADEQAELVSALRGRAITLADLERRAAKAAKPAYRDKRAVILALIAKVEQAT